MNRVIPSDAICLGRFGDLGLFEGAWPIIGQSEAWDPARWPMPSFGREDDISGRFSKITYSSDDPTQEIDESPCSPQTAKKLPEDGLMGAGYVEEVLDDLLPL